MLVTLGWAAPSVSAQEVLTGTVTNAATGRTLEGATVAIAGTDRQVLTDSGGNYRLTNVAPGAATLSVSYTGLDTAEVPVTIVAGAANRRDVGLTADVYSLGEFVVSGEREGNAQAITLQRQSQGIRSIVSTDVLGSLAGNPADLVMRLPGVEGESVGGDIRYVRIRGLNQNLNSVTMDGNRVADAASAGATREFQFQTIGSDSIERIEVVKLPTPDMDGDSIGGTVNMVSKSAFDSSPERRIGLSVGAIARFFDDREDLPLPNFAVSYSEVFHDKVGVAFNFGMRSHNSIIDVATAAHQNVAEGVSPAYTYNFAYQDFRNRRQRTGGGLKVDFKHSETTRFYVNVTYNWHDEKSRHTQTTFAAAQRVASLDANGNPIGTANPIKPGYTDTYTETYPFNDSSVSINSFKPGKDGMTLHTQVGAVHRYPLLDIEYDIYRSRSRTIYAGNETFAYTLRGVGFAIDARDERYYPSVRQTAGPDWTDVNNYQENLYTVARSKAWDAYEGAAINVKKSFELPVPSYIKIGVRQRNQSRDREDTSYRTRYVGPDGVMGVNPATGVNDDNLAQFGFTGRGLPDTKLSRYQLMPWPEFPSTGVRNVADVYRERPQEFADDIMYNVTQPLNNAQNFEEKITGYYVMGNVMLGRLSVLGGVRAEHTKVWGAGALVGITPEEAARRAAWVGPVTPEETARRWAAQYGQRQERSGKNKDVFPGVHFRYDLSRNLLLRLGYASNIGRPSIGQLIPATTVNYDNQTVSTSNPSLLPQYSDNFDLSFEYYFEPAGMLSGGVFYKEISRFIYTSGGATVGDGLDNGFNGEFAGYTLTTQYNGGFAKIKGFELSYQQQFNFLPGFWKYFNIFANYTRMDIEGNYGAGGAISLAPTEEVAGFNPENANVAVSYIRGPLTLRFNVNYRARHLTAYNVSWALRQYAAERTTLDIKTAYRFNRRFSAYLDVINVTKTPDRLRVSPADQLRVQHLMSPQFFFGVNARL